MQFFVRKNVAKVQTVPVHTSGLSFLIYFLSTAQNLFGIFV